MLFQKMILVEIDGTSPLLLTDRVVIIAESKVIKHGLLSHVEKTDLLRIRYANDSYKKKIPTDGIFWPLFPDWHYDAMIMNNLRVARERIIEDMISTDTIKMFYDTILHILTHVNKKMTDELEFVWITYGKRMCEYKQHCMWVESFLEEGWHSYNASNMYD